MKREGEKGKMLNVKLLGFIVFGLGLEPGVNFWGLINRASINSTNMRVSCEIGG